MTDLKIEKKNVEDMVGLTAMQEGMLFHYLSDPGSKQYLEQIRLGLSGNIQVEEFKQAWNSVVQTNEMLRAVIRWEKLEEPVQIVLRNKEIPIRVFDLSGEPREGQHQSLEREIENDRAMPLDLTRDPLRVTLFILNDREGMMLITFHHIIYDGWSTGIILREFIDAYHVLSLGETPPVLQKTKYKDFYKAYRGLDQQKQDEFWKAYFNNFDTRTLLPYDKTKTEDIRNVQTLKLEIPPSLKSAVDRCLQHHNLTLAALMFITWGILLQKYNNSDDIVFGTTVAGRTAPVKGIEDIVGMFINTLPVRLNTTGNHTLSHVFRDVTGRLNERTPFEHIPLTRIKQFSGIGKDSSLFDSIVVIDNYPLEGIRPRGDLALTSYELFEMTNFDLTLQVLPSHTLEICFHFNQELFLPVTLERMVRHFSNILEGVVHDPGLKISAVPMISESEKEQILFQFNTPDIRYTGDKTIHGIIREQAAKTPDNKAVQYEGQWMTYREFDETTDRLALLLGEHGVTLGSRVALMFPRSLEMIVGIVAVLKAGASCIPLDITYPQERNGFIIEDSGAKILLTHPDIRFVHTSGAEEILYNREKIDSYTVTRKPGDTVAPGDLSYIIYTSGSTGNPKGALLNHWGIVNHTYTKIQVLGITGADTVGNNFSVNVIASIWQILSPLFTGAKLVLYSDQVEWDPYEQFRRVSVDRVTVIEVIPPVLKAFLFLLDEGKPPINLDSLRRIALTSEETKPFLVRKFHEHYTRTRLVDCYGMTECCDDILHYTIPADVDTMNVPIGTPSLNTRVLIFNHHNQLQPVGVAGEICASGAGVGEGYWNRPQMTAEKFVANPLEPEIRMYRTGDLGRWLPDGKVEYLGRIDHQVKIRGNRVELREIENHIIGFEPVKEAAVIAKEDNEGEKALFAFFVSQRDITVSEIRQYLLKTLPDYMVPAHFIPIENLPVTPNGKLDRKALARIEIKESIAGGAPYKPPRSEYEQKIEVIWRQLLDKEKIGTDDNFFDLGGHSLLLIKLKSRLEKSFDREISIIQLFNYPTISHQARYFEFGEESGPAAPAPHTESEGAGNRDIAVIGISLQVPGARDIREFWENIVDGVESISFFREDEVENSEVEHFVKGSSRLIPAGGVLGDIDLFDADFFGFNPREAEIIDPQQRLFIEHAWMTLEDAGYCGETYPGRIGVYGGVGMNTYLLNNVMSNRAVVNSLGEFQTMIGNDKDFLATRVSYKLNLKGPALTVQTACSTALVAVHLARQALLNRECEMALAGGVAVHVPEKSGYFYNEGGYLSPDGHCRAFDANAQGTVFSNGIGIVLLKSLETAIADNDHIYAVIKGSAINNDGSFKVGYTSPSEIGQSGVISSALEDARIHPETIRYIETHGTGTVLGDPMEIAALNRAYRVHTQKKQYCAVGSLKSNLGHMDIAAGVIGLIKTVLCLRHKLIPPGINVREPNPIIDFPNTPFYVALKAENWETGETPRRAGVSSFGIGGTNAHIILEEWPDTPSTGGKSETQNQLLLLSAGTETALEKMTRSLVDVLSGEHTADMDDIAYTLTVGRKAFDHRLALVCRDREDALHALANLDRKRVIMHTRQGGEKSAVFMFPGVGEHYVNMAYDLYRTEPLFRHHVDHCCRILTPILGTDLRDVIFNTALAEASESRRRRGQDQSLDLKTLVNRDDRTESEEQQRLNKTIYSQTAVFTVEYALAKLVISWGITPYAMIGYSIGEYTAACLSGVFSLEDALYLVAHRAQLIHSLEQGAMTAVALPKKELQPLLPEGVSLVAENTPDLCIISGNPDAVQALETQLKQLKAVYRRLKTFQAFHSHMMEPVRPQLTQLFQKFTINPPTIPYISNVTGTWITNREVVNPAYWVTHTVSPIRFSEGLGELLKTSCNFFVEIGPGNSLSGFTAQHPESRSSVERYILATMPKESENVSDRAFLLRAVGKLWAAGMYINWTSFYGNKNPKRVPLPTYPFEKKRYWLEAGTRRTDEFPVPVKEQGAVRIAKKENIADWFYIPSWKQSMPPMASLSREGNSTDAENRESWLLFLDEPDCGIGIQLIGSLKSEAYPPDISIVTIGAHFERNNLYYTINPTRTEDYIALLEDMQEQGKSIDKIVHLWQWNASPDFLHRGVYSLLYLVKAMGRLSIFDTVEFWLVSKGMHRIENGDSSSPQKTAVLGPCKVVSQEYTNIVCRSIDFEENTSSHYDEKRIAQDLISELHSSPPDRIIAYRGSSRWVQSFEPVKLEKTNQTPVPPVLRENGVYLITGGLGKIGLSIAQYLAQTVHARLVLTTRSPLSGEDDGGPRMMKVHQLRELGAEILVVRADAADKEQMRLAVTKAEETFGALHGVLHAAGVMDENAFKLIADLEKEHCELHFNAKIHGLLVLEEVLRDKPLDFCILTSSLSPILGGLSLYAYSAANSFMDGFARRKGLEHRENWFSINWADWEREEPANDGCANLVLGSTVFQLNINPEEGKETFERVLSLFRPGGEPRAAVVPGIVVSSGDLSRRLRQWAAISPENENDSDSNSSASGDKPVLHQRPRLQSIFEAPQNEPEKIVVEIWQDLLGIDLVGVHDNFFELGGHSLIATRLISRLREIFRIDIPLPTLFNKPTVRELVDTINHSWGDRNIVLEIAETYREVQLMN